MQFQISNIYKGQHLTMTVKRAVYFDRIVYQVSAENFRAIVYQKDGEWQSTNDKLIDKDLLGKIGAGILDNVGIKQAS
jgi:hypothetical protein